MSGRGSFQTPDGGQRLSVTYSRGSGMIEEAPPIERAAVGSRSAIGEGLCCFGARGSAGNRGEGRGGRPERGMFTSLAPIARSPFG